MDGVLVIDKPQGVTSHDVVAAVRRSLREKRIGHTGTLDPLATGVLPLACGRATRLVRFLSASDKEYEAVIRFGITTDSYDITGAETGRSGRVPAREEIERGLASLRGEYAQTPPAFSAKRIQGRRAYELARRDEPVALEAVPVRVSRADLVELAGDSATVAITCSAGFYVRTFAHELGRLTGTGACLERLRRTRSGDFGLTDAMTLEEAVSRPEAVATRLVPMDVLLPRVPAVRLTEEGRRRVTHGQEVAAPHLAPDEAGPLVHADAGEGWVRLLDAAGALVAVARPGSLPGSLHPAIVLI
jgi:tRNA pseudouridine55 synthase